MDKLQVSFTRYLSAKKTVDDRALNRQVWQCMAERLPNQPPDRPLPVIEIGAGTGTMLERMIDWGLLGNTSYTAVDEDPANIAVARQRLSARAGTQAIEGPGDLVFAHAGGKVVVELQVSDVFDFFPRERGRRSWDLLVAHAFLDLVDIPRTLPQLFSLVRPGGFFYFSLNFDGLTLFEPGIDQAFDDHIQALYHRTMDERVTQGRPSGDSRSGRHLFTHLNTAGATILAAGSSDWVVFPTDGVYPYDEAYFLHFIIHTVQQALVDNPELGPDRLERWIAKRHAQIERGELVYIAHQIDFFGNTPLDGGA
jgi:SAM-dependent methyltransferase